MKGKFRILGHIGIGVLLVCALMLAFMPVAPVAAATAVTSVWVDFPFTDSINATSDTDGSNIYIVHFKTTTALSRGADSVTVTFPDGSEAMCGTAASTRAFIVSTLVAGDVKFSTDYNTTDLINGATWTQLASDPTIGGNRVKATVPINIAAGTDVWVQFDDADNGGAIQSGSVQADAYKVYVSTTKDTTQVLSSAFALGTDTLIVTATAMEASYPIPTTAGSTAEYIVKFTPTTSVVGTSGKVTVKFPVGTTLPSSMTATNVLFNTDGGSYSPCSETPTVDTDRRTITAIPSITLTLAKVACMKILSGAGITNPSIADDSSIGAKYMVAVRTSADGQWDASGAFSITAGTGTKVQVANGEIGKATARYSDNATMINMWSSQIWVTLADANGNGVTPASATTLSISSSSTTGSFAINANATGTDAITTGVTSTSIDATDGYDPNANPLTQIFYYKDSTAGTHTLTFSASGYTSATWTFTVCPGVSLYDASNNLISTYAPLSTDTVSETVVSTEGYAQYYSGDYINSAITAAFAGDTVKLGTGIYEIDDVSSNYINVNEKITLTSVSGASSTTLRPVSDADDAIYVTTSGTATNPIIIDGFTFDRLRYGVEFDEGVSNINYDYVTVRNCVFNYIQPTLDIDDAHGATVEFMTNDASSNITSGTISNNTFNYCGGVTDWDSGAKSAAINVMAKHGTADISGVTVSGNTLNNCDGYGIELKGYSASLTVVADVTNNTITNGRSSIEVSNGAGASKTSNCTITGNTITGAYSYGIKIDGEYDFGMTIKNNTITGCGGTYAIRIYHIPFASATYATYGTHYIQYNDIYNNASGCYAIQVDSQTGETVTLNNIDCRYNWYGDASGPAYTAVTGATITKSNPNGTGGAITDRVFYYPWLHKPLADVVADNVSWQTSVMKLVSGWNTLSTPVPLIEAADSVAELIPSGSVDIAYYYDGSWQQILTEYTLSPCDAVYVKMLAPTYVQFKFDAKTFSTPSKDLDAGWNLASLASLAAGGMEADDAVASVYKTAANLPGYAQVVSPSINATQTDMYGNTGTSWTYSSGQTASIGSMFAGMGYWVYMQNAATLAGFEITPIAPDLD